MMLVEANALKTNTETWRALEDAHFAEIEARGGTTDAEPVDPPRIAADARVRSIEYIERASPVSIRGERWYLYTRSVEFAPDEYEHNWRCEPYHDVSEPPFACVNWR
jgi:hypothetical protein